MKYSECESGEAETSFPNPNLANTMTPKLKTRKHHLSSAPTASTDTTSYDLILQHSKSLYKTIKSQKRTIENLKNDLMARDYVIENLKKEVQRERKWRIDMMERGAVVFNAQVPRVPQQAAAAAAFATPPPMAASGNNKPQESLVGQSSRSPAAAATTVAAQSVVTPSIVSSRLTSASKPAKRKSPFLTPNKKQNELLGAIERQFPHHHASPHVIKSIERKFFHWTTVRDHHVEMIDGEAVVRSTKSFGSAMAKDFTIDPQKETCKFSLKVRETPAVDENDDLSSMEGNTGLRASGDSSKSGTDQDSYMLIGLADAHSFSVENSCGMSDDSYAVDTCYGQKWTQGVSKEFYNAPIRKGDVITITVHHGRMVVEVNDEYVGVAFRKMSQVLCPCVTFLGAGYEIEVLHPDANTSQQKSGIVESKPLFESENQDISIQDEETNAKASPDKKEADTPDATEFDESALDLDLGDLDLE